MPDPKSLQVPPSSMVKLHDDGDRLDRNHPPMTSRPYHSPNDSATGTVMSVLPPEDEADRVTVHVGADEHSEIEPVLEHRRRDC